MELIANRQICGSGRLIAPGEAFAEDEDTARELILSGLARERYALPYTYETKVVTPEVKPIVAAPFRDVPPVDEKPPALVALESAVRAVSDLPEQRNPRRIQRRKT